MYLHKLYSATNYREEEGALAYAILGLQEGIQ
jgi:hypothetical protein